MFLKVDYNYSYSKDHDIICSETTNISIKIKNTHSPVLHLELMFIYILMSLLMRPKYYISFADDTHSCNKKNTFLFSHFIK